ncbi:MAG: T9SS type A sorting domain-containing protein [Bacteroidia bacterium]|nr:T9SS type A sorting domain-containing protein [Bacteroidia bacterium]
MKNIYTLVATLLIASTTMAQSDKIIPCFTEEHRAEMAKKDPSLDIKRAAYEAEIAAYIANNATQKQAQSVTKIIPVVVHVLHVGGVENISKAQIDDQIRVMNEAYSYTNMNKINIPTQFLPICGTANIEFRLAKLDPTGNCTEGITRTYTSLTNQTANRDDVKKVVYWPSNKYLNIWLVKGIESGSGGTAGIILGYAQFPGGAASTDGLVIRHDYFGTIGTANASDLGSTANHEIGHWLNLRHIWGDQPCGNDLVSDTPVHENANQSFCPAYPWHANNTCGAGADGEMYFNYMDYTTGACQAAFSTGQCTRMNAALNSSTSGRNNLWSANNMTATGVLNTTTTCIPKAEYTPTNYKIICKGNNVVFTDNSYNGIPTSYSWSFQGGTPATSIKNTDTIKYNTAGVYDVNYTTTNATGSSTITKTGYIIVLDNASGIPATVYGDSFEDPNTFAQNWLVLNKDNDAAKFQNTGTTGYAGSRSMMLNNYVSNSKMSDEVISPAIDFTGVTSAQLKFRYAFSAVQSTDNDKVEMYVQSDCNIGFVGTSKFTKIANTSSTATNLSPILGHEELASYIPTAGSVTEWKLATVNLGVISNKPNVRFKFVFTGGNGNNFFVDDVQIASIVTSVKNTAASLNSFSLSPNPATTQATLYFELEKTATVNIAVTNLLGQTVNQIVEGSLNQGEHSYDINTAKLTSGVYLVVLTSNGNKIVKKLIVE